MPILAEITRNEFLESQHHGHLVVMHTNGDVLLEIGDAERAIFPRSSCKMIQALPLMESGAAREFGLNTEQLALACASHNGERMHTQRVENWLGSQNFNVEDLRCGPQKPSRLPDRLHLHDNGQICTRVHNNCSGKHAGFLTLNAHLSGGSEYHELDHPVQIACKATFEELTEMESMGHGIDGCNAPNFMTTVRGLARAAAHFSAGEAIGGVRGNAMTELCNAMMKHPLLVAGTNRACSELMAAASGRAAIKTGAEAVYMGIFPDLNIGVALKIEDGSTRASECAIAAIMVRLGVVDAKHPAVKKRLNPELRNYSDRIVGGLRPSDELWKGGMSL